MLRIPALSSPKGATIHQRVRSKTPMQPEREIEPFNFGNFLLVPAHQSAPISILFLFNHLAYHLTNSYEMV